MDRSDLDEDMVVMDGFDDCIAGICSRFGQEDIVIYDYDKIIEKLMDDGMDMAEAEEYFDFNIIGAWVGDGTPAFLRSTI